MIRIRGHVGELPVDLSIEMDDHDWAQLARQLPAAQAETAPVPPADKPPADPHWPEAQRLLRAAAEHGRAAAVSGAAGAGR